MKKNWMPLSIILTLGFINPLHGKTISCLPRAEMGETIEGSNIYERDKDLKINNLSTFDFDKLTIISAKGTTSKMINVDENIYKSIGGKFTFYFITNNEKTMVSELSVGSSATYVKILLCK